MSIYGSNPYLSLKFCLDSVLNAWIISTNLHVCLVRFFELHLGVYSRYQGNLLHIYKYNYLRRRTHQNHQMNRNRITELLVRLQRLQNPYVPAQEPPKIWKYIDITDDNILVYYWPVDVFIDDAGIITIAATPAQLTYFRISL